MSILSVDLHQIANSLAADWDAFKKSLEPEVATAAAVGISTIDSGVNNLVTQAGAAVAAEAQAIPYFGPGIAAAITAGLPTVVADLKAAEAQATAFISALDTKL